MFARRVNFLLAILAVPVVLIVLRLVQLQIVRADFYQALAEQMLVQPARIIPSLRGEITDRRGRRLAYDTPSWDICVHYGALSGDRDYLRAVADRLRRRSPMARLGEPPDMIEASWRVISELTGQPRSCLDERARAIVRKVERVKARVEGQWGAKTTIREERMFHPVARGLDQRQQVAALVRLADYPWVEVIAGRTRQCTGGAAVGHLVGLLGEVTEADIDCDPNADDEHKQYEPGDERGIAGVEVRGEQWLRGRRGLFQEDRRGRPVRPPIEPQNGRDFRLTIDLELQQAVYERLAEAVRTTSLSTGGSAVVIDIPTRQVLAMVSYPSLEPAASLAERIEAEAADPLHGPHVFRAVGGYYPPGSIVKPAVLAGALADRVLLPETQITCEGRLFADIPDKWRCSGIHGPVGVVRALTKSCNVFLYGVGQQMGIQKLAAWMSLFGLGRESGTGLPEEQPGRVPSTVGVGAARHAAIGQGQFVITPIQAANMIATLASGVYRPVTIWADDPSPPPAVPLPVDAASWRIVRQGMFEVVNDPEGTGYGPDKATLVGAGDYVLLGKTGSAQASRRPLEWLYTCQFPDGYEERIAERSASALRARFPADSQPRIVATTPYRLWPPPDQDSTHAWFVGYIVKRGHYLEPAISDDLNVAIAVVIEYGVKGGTVAGPVAHDMIHQVLSWHARTDRRADGEQ